MVATRVHFVYQASVVRLLFIQESRDALKQETQRKRVENLNYMSQTRRRNSQGPPARLGWPAACSSGSASVSESCNVAPRKAKRSRKTSCSINSPKLWTERYAPTQVQHVCVAPKKAKEIARWIEEAALLRPHSGKLLILVGAPGIGKSTLVRLIAKERRMQVAECNESCTTSFLPTTGNTAGILTVDQQSPLDSFQQFLEECGAGCLALDLSLSQKPKQQVVVDRTGDNNNEASPSTTSKKRKSSWTMKSAADKLEGHTLILLEELPNLHTPDAKRRFQHIMDQHVRHSVVPTVLIVSDVVEGKCRPDLLEGWISPSLLYHSSAVRKIEIHPPTQARFYKALQRVAADQGFAITKYHAQNLHQQTHGDLRSAIYTLQFEHTGGCSQKKAAPGTTTTLATHDQKLSTFHALGKLLYAKRKSLQPKNRSRTDDRGPLEFDPENVIEQSAADIGSVLSFVGFHGVDFFSDVSELSGALDHFSDAAFLLDRPSLQQGRYSHGSHNSLFPNAYAASLAGRAVAHANRHPAPNKFRSFSAPKVFEVMRKRRENQWQLQYLDQRLSASHRLALGRSGLLASDQLPYMRKLLPAHVLGGSLDRLHSNFRPMNSTKGGDESVEVEEARWKEQEAILELDDIVEDEDSLLGEEEEMQEMVKVESLKSLAERSACNGSPASSSPTSTMEPSVGPR